MSIAGLEDYLNREFGELDEGSLERQTGRRAMRLLDQAPSASPSVPTQSGIPEWKPPVKTAAGDGDSSLLDIPIALAGGVVEVGESLLGGVEYLARQNKFTRDTAVQSGITTARRATGDFAQSILDTITPQGMDEMGREWLSGDPDKTIWQGGPGEFAMAVALKMAHMLPSTLATLAPAALWFRGAMAAKALNYMSASEAALTLGGIANGVANEIEQTPHEQLLAESQRYTQLYAELGDESSAKNQLITEAQGATPVYAAVFVAAISRTTGKYLEPVFLKQTVGGVTRPGLTAGQRFGRGFLAEAAQEGPQSAAEQLATNLSAQLYDEDRNLSEGVAEAATEGAVIGGLTGGGFTAAMGQRPDRPMPDPVAEPSGQLNLPGFGPQQSQGIPDETPPDGPEGAYVPNTGMGLQTELWPESGTTDATLVTEPIEQELIPEPTEQGVLPLGIVGTETLAERGPNHRVLEQGDIIPDEMDQPTAEPVVDIQAQLEDMKGAGGRSAVYISPAQRNDNITLPKGAVVIPNFDGKGGVLIAKNDAAATHARKIRAEGGSMQAIIGELTLAGVGKPLVRAGYAVQLLDENGAVARESLVATRTEANELKKTWIAEIKAEATPAEEQFTVSGTRQKQTLTKGTKKKFNTAEEAEKYAATQRNKGTVVEIIPNENNSTVVVNTRKLGEKSTVAVPSETFSSEEEAKARKAELQKSLGKTAKLGIKRRVTKAAQPSPKTIKVLTGTAALARRGAIIEKEQIDVSSDPASVAEATGDLFEGQQAPTLQAADNQSTTGDFQVQMTDEQGNEIVTEMFATQEEASARSDKLIEDFPDAFVTSKPTRVAATPTKAGISTTKRIPKKVLKGPPEGPPPRPSSEDKSTESTQVEKASVAPEEFDESISVKDIEDLPNFVATFSVITEETQPNKSTKIVEVRESKEFTTRKAAKSHATRMSNKARKIAGPDYTINEGVVTAKSTPELEEQFASAAQSRADRKMETTAEEEGKKVGDFAADSEARFDGPEGVGDESNPLLDKYAAANASASQKVQFIRRERASMLRRRATIKQVKATSATTLTAGGTTRETKTQALTYERVSGEETSAQEIKRKASIREANTRLRFALNRAMKFLDRFDTTGEYGTYVGDNTNVDGSLTKTAQQFMAAREAFHELVSLANAALTSGNTSNAHAMMVKQIAVTLERIKLKTMNPAQFIKEFNAIANSTEYKMLRTVPKGMRESATKRDKNVNKLNNERHNANVRKALLESKWAKDKIWSEIVGPIFRKFSEALLINAAAPSRNVYYKPTEFEMENLRYALRTFRRSTAKYDSEEFYTPIKEQLEYYGMEFDSEGDLIVQEFSPSNKLLGSGFKASFKMSPKAADEIEGGPVREAATEVPSSTRIREDRDTGDRVQSVVGINTANALLSKLKDMISSAKTTISGIKRQEQRFIRGLRKLGVWTDTAPGMGQISFGGYSSRTYRLVGPRLDKRTMTKGEAKGVIDRMKHFAIPRELTAQARMLRNDSSTATQEEFIEDNATGFFLEELALEENSPALDNAASTVGDMIRDRNTQAPVSDVLDAIIAALPANHFYRRLAEKLRSMDMPVTLQYDWTNTKFFGKKRNNLGAFDPTQNRAYLNRRRMLDQMGTLTGSKAIHTMLHEILHAATHSSLARRPALQAEMLEIRTAAHNAWVKENGSKNIPVGLRLTNNKGEAMPIDEFVVEMFNDENLQDHLRNTSVESATGFGAAMTKIRDIILEFLGWGNTPNMHNLLDKFMSNADSVFENAGVAREGSEVLNLDVYDSVLRKPAAAVMDRVKQHTDIIERVKNVGRTVLLNLQTMEQFVENYAKEFIVEGKSMLQQYSDAFNARNARASEYMNVPQEVSRIWTLLEESDPAAALEVSRIGTEASMHRVAAAEAPEGDNAVHADLHSRYNALSQDAKTVYDSAKAYYADANKREHLFLMQSALRGILTNKQGVGLSIDIFEAKFNVAELEKIESREDLDKMIEEYIPAEGRIDILDLLYRMSVVPRQASGDYFPAMRYGDEVVYAEKMTNEQIFEDRKEAMGVRKSISATDPTLDVQILDLPDGRVAVRTFEREFVMAESVSEIEEAHARLVKEYGKDFVFDTQKRRSKQIDSDISSNAALNSIIKTLDGNPAAQAAIKNFYLRSLSEASFRKHEMKRKNRRGLNYDTQHRNLAAYAKQASYYTAQLEFGWKMAEALSGMDQYVGRRQASEGQTSTRKLRDIVEHLKKRDQMSVDLPDVQELVRKGVEYTHFFMLTSPSYWAINATQPWLVSAPTMAARHGWGQTISAMGAMQKLIKAPLIEQAVKTKGGFASLRKGSKALTEEAFDVIHQLEDHIRKHDPVHAAEYIALLESLRARHIIDINVFTEMRDQAAGRKQNTRDRVIDASRIMAHLTEVNNRVLVALTAYQLEINAGKSVKEATEWAGDMVSQTQFNYSSNNKPPLFQAGGPLGGVAPLMFQFMQWPQHMYAHLIRNYRGMVDAGIMNKSEARSALLGLLGTHAAVGGMTGMLLQPIKWAIGFTMMALGDDDEPYTFANAVSGRTADRLIASTADDMFGTRAATFISKGIPAGFGVDLSVRMSMGTMYFIDLRGDTAQSALGSIVASFGGATLNQGVNLARGMAKIANGDIYRGIEAMSPKIARDFLRSIRYANEGLVNNAGDTVIPASEMSYGEIVAQSLGFAPTDVALFYEAQNAVKDAEAYARDRGKELLKQFRLADPTERRTVMREVRRFNRANPAERITYTALYSNVKGKKIRESRYRRYGVNIDERKARFYAKYSDPYRE